MSLSTCEDASALYPPASHSSCVSLPFSCGLASFCPFVATPSCQRSGAGSQGGNGKQSNFYHLSLVTPEERTYLLSASRNKKMLEKNSDWSNLHSNLCVIGRGHHDWPGMGHMVPLQPGEPCGVGRVLSIEDGIYEKSHCKQHSHQSHRPCSSAPLQEATQPSRKNTDVIRPQFLYLRSGADSSFLSPMTNFLCKLSETIRTVSRAVLGI